MDTGEFRRRLLIKALAAPTVVFPGLFGATAAAVGLAAGDFWGFTGFLGVTGVLWAVGAGFGRVMLRSDKLGKEVLDEAASAKESSALGRLKEVERRLEKTRDPRTFEVIRRLREQRLRLVDAIEKDTFPVPPEIASRSESLYTSCVDSLDRSADLWEAARKMATQQARQELMSKREGLLDEVRESVAQFALTLDRLQAAPLQREATGAELASIREELDQELSVARRVEERMRGLDRDISPDPQVRLRE